MKKFFIFLILIILFLVFVAQYNSNPKIIISELFNKGDIKSGELRYKIYLLGVLPIGDAFLGDEKIEEYKGQKVYHLSATAQSSRIFSRLFSGSAILDSYVDMQQFNPMSFRQRLQVSGKKDIDREIIYDQKQSIMSIGGTRRQIFPDTQDPLSVVFNLRRMDFDKNKEFEMNINTNQKNYILKGTAEQKELSINKKIYKIVLTKAEIKRRDKNPYHQSTIAMVLLKEKGNIPILIKVFAGGILINAKLVDIE